MRKIVTLFLVVFLSIQGFSQDPHLSMFYHAPQQLNPALTGVFNGNYRFNMLYRSQWGEILRDESVSQFRTMTAGVDFRFPVEKAALGFGLNVLNDKAAASEFGTTKAGFTLSYLQNLDRNAHHYLSFGIQGNMIQRSFNPIGLRFGNQWNGVEYDPMIGQDNPGYLASLSQNFIFFDVGLGLLYYMRGRNERVSSYIGGSFQHLNEPNQSFGGTNAQLPIRFSAHAGVNFPIAKHFDLLPKFLFQSQGQNIETLIGTDIRFIFDDRDPRGNAFKIGALYRLAGGLNPNNVNSLNSEAIALITGIDYAGLTLGIAYDINISEFTAGTFTRGGFELALTYKGAFNQRINTNVTCPTF